MREIKTRNLNIAAGSNPVVVLITDAPSAYHYERGHTLSPTAGNLINRHVKLSGLTMEDVVIINACPPIPQECGTSDSRIGKFVDSYRQEFLEALAAYLPSARLIIPMGKNALRQLSGRAAAITKSRGTFTTYSASGSIPVLPIFSPQNVLARPDSRPLFEADFQQVRAIKECGWDMESFLSSGSSEGYRWCLDLQPLLDNRPKAISFDTETVGTSHHEPGFRVLCASITPRSGVSYVVPLDIDYWNDPARRGSTSAHLPMLTDTLRSKLIAQIQELVSDQTIAVSGHNLKYDIHAAHAIGIEVENFYADTMQLAFVCDENMQSKTLADCTRRWLPEMAGYSYAFDARVDKARMDLVDHDDMLPYSGGDTDATYRLSRILIQEAKEDPKNWQCFLKIQMPALRSFVKMERQGVCVDEQALRDLGVVLDARERELYHSLLSRIPDSVKRRHEGAWSFNRPAFLVDILFGPEGVRDESGARIRPLEFTAGTKDFEDPRDRVPSTSADHLGNFAHIDLVADLIEYQQLYTMRTRYVGKDAYDEVSKIERLKNGRYPTAVDGCLMRNGIDMRAVTGVRFRGESPLPPPLETIDIPSAKAGVYLRATKDGNVFKVTTNEASGFWQYLKNRNTRSRIHPSFFLHRAVTGRTASSDPNGQNLPKRGPLAKHFRRIFVPTPGYVFGEFDLSQAEIRIAACMAKETEMIRVYARDGDIHSTTAAVTMGISEEKFTDGISDETPLIEVWREWPGAEQYLRSVPSTERRKVTVADFCDLKRFQAKAVNFGFLYGMSWQGFRRYAKTDYKINYTKQEAEEIRTAFFSRYRKLAAWHQQMKDAVMQQGHVRALHGAIRRLPNVTSYDQEVISGAIRQAINSPVQRFSSDLGLMAMNRIARDADPEKLRAVLFIHDSLVTEIREDVVEEMGSAVKFYMETPPLESWFGLKLPVPIKADSAVGPSLDAMKKRPDIKAVQPSWYRSGESPSIADEKMLNGWELKRRRSIVLID